MSEGEQQERNFSFSVNPMPDQAVTNLISQLISQRGATTLTHHLPHHLLRGTIASRKDSLKGAGKTGVRHEGADLGKGRGCGDIELKFVGN